MRTTRRLEINVRERAAHNLTNRRTSDGSVGSATVRFRSSTGYFWFVYSVRGLWRSRSILFFGKFWLLSKNRLVKTRAIITDVPISSLASRRFLNRRLSALSLVQVMDMSRYSAWFCNFASVMQSSRVWFTSALRRTKEHRGRDQQIVADDEKKGECQSQDVDTLFEIRPVCVACI